ncbi:MAG: hypothetical protein EBR82_07010 [Caulobacteraceae bacterium]|nr:hypothetical protein [Caulobacteraceae bacterium]
MDFMKILRSFEEFVFEAASWLIFYPLTMWRIIRRPLATMDYSDREQGEAEDRRYNDTLSPPLVLLATIVLWNLIAFAAHVPELEATSTVTKTLAASQQNLILFRSLMFSLIPLISAASLVHRQGKQLSRETLRAPFYAQCYLAAPCAAFVSAGGIVLQRPDIPNIIGGLAVLAGAAWFMVIQTIWFRHKLATSYVKAAAVALWAVARALGILLIVAAVVALF